ncbi:MAG: hypothetical protein HRT74_04660 [Flavobacteriales bacterium]|nr:hypothetical protein [Flavobacteriales bacterium]
MKFLLLTSTFFVSLLVSAQCYIQGVVVDENNQPITGAYVFVTDGPTVSTNINGVYSIELPCNELVEIKITAIG